jgi:hypothetical protein
VIGIGIKGVTNPNGVLSDLTCTSIGQNRARTTQNCTIYIQYIQGLCQSRLSTADFALILVASATSLVTESESYVTTDGQSASLPWYKAPIRGLRPDFYFRTEYGMSDSYVLDSVGRPL